MHEKNTHTSVLIKAGREIIILVDHVRVLALANFRVTAVGSMVGFISTPYQFDKYISGDAAWHPVPLVLVALHEVQIGFR